MKVFEPAVLAGALLAVEMGTAAYPGLEDPDARVEAVVTPNASPELGAALQGLRRSGIEAGIVWVRPGESRDRDGVVAALEEVRGLT